MLNKLDSLTERVGGINSLVDQWLQTRKNLLIAYYHLAGTKPQKGCRAALDEKALDDFCQGLVDYLSAGHFYVYHRMLDTLVDQKRLEESHNIFLALENNTQRIMAIYDSQLEMIIVSDDGYALHNALSTIGEYLASHFLLEDKLLLLLIEDTSGARLSAKN